MNDFVLATNGDGRLEAFYVEDSTVKHTWQLSPSDPLSWSNPGPLYGENSSPLSNVTHVGACTSEDGFIHVVARTSDGSYYLCSQVENAGNWQGWFSITQS